MLIIRHIAALSVLDDPALQKTKPHTGDEYGIELVAPGRILQKYMVLGSILHAYGDFAPLSSRCMYH